MSLMIPSQTIRRGMAAMALGAGIALSGVAQAQFGEAAGIAELMLPEYLKRDMQIFEQGLNLDDAQSVILEALFRDYEASFEHGMQKMRDRFETMRDELSTNDTDRVLAIVFAPLEDWGVERGQLGEQFKQNVQVVLTEEQLAMWPAFERRLTREKTLHLGRLSGENVDLFAILREMRLDEKTMEQVQPMLEAYDISLDEALRRRNAALSPTGNKMLRSMAAQDTAEQMKELERQIVLRLAVRNVNDQYIETVAAALPAEYGGELREKALDRAYPRVYRQTPVQRMFTSAKELENLESSVLGAITALEAQYLAELQAINATLHQALRSWEPEEAKHRAQAFAERTNNLNPQPVEDPTRDLFLRRDDISRNYAKQLQAILSPEQFAALPGAYRWVEQPQQEEKTLPGNPKQRGGAVDTLDQGSGSGKGDGGGASPRRGGNPQ